MAAITCTEPDCERPARGRGLCGTHYAYNRRRGTLPPLPPRVTICTAPACENPIGPAGARGLCPKHYQRVTKSKWGLQQPPRTAPLRERFYAKVSKEPCPCGCDCRLWTGGISYDGYGHFSIGNKSYNAHRVAYELEVGPIPDGLAIDHVYESGCRHRHCVKPEHLEAVTARLNNQRMPMTPRRLARLSAAGRKGAASRWGHPFAPCDDCGQMTVWRDRPSENYVVYDTVWAAAGMDPAHIPDDDDPNGTHYYLCIGCLEARLGRELTSADFTDVPLNRDPGRSRTPRLLNRLQRQ